MPASDVVFITGAGGFVGSAVARELSKAGFALRALVRPGSPTTNLEGLAAELVEGDMRDASAVFTATKGARYVFHVAADYRLWSPEPEEILSTNIEGTRTVMEAAKAAVVERVVYTSSVATSRRARTDLRRTRACSSMRQRRSGLISAAKLPPSGSSEK